MYDKFVRFHDIFSKLFKFFEIEKDQNVMGDPSTIILIPPYLGVSLTRDPSQKSGGGSAYS